VIAKVTVCPFLDPEHLAQCIENGIEPLEIQTQPIFEELRQYGPATKEIITRLEDTHLAEINAGVNEVLRRTICVFCDTNRQCHPA
jgi:hypothetical protein